MPDSEFSSKIQSLQGRVAELQERAKGAEMEVLAGMLEGLSIDVEELLLVGEGLYQQKKEERRRAEEQALKELTFDLNERVKELNCLYGISNLVQKPGIALEEILQGTVDLIPPAWQYPDVTCARITLDGQEYRTKNFNESAWRQTADIVVDGEPEGTLDVYYLGEASETGGRPFLDEEASLVNAIAERLGRITERTRAESHRDATLEALRESEARWRSLAQSSPDHILTLDTELNIQFVNYASPGLTVEELIGTPLHSYVEEERQLEIKAILENVLTTGEPASYETEYHAPGGTTYYESRVVPRILDGGTVGLTLIARDITERVQTEALLRSQNQFITTVFESLRHPFYVIDASDYTITMANSAAHSGDFPETVTCYALTHRRTTPCGDAGHLCPMEEIKKTGKPVVVEHTHYDKEGVPRVFEVHGHPIFDDEGKVVQIIEYTLDVTERNQAEMALRERTHELGTLLEISRSVALIQDLETLLGLVLERLEAVVGYGGATIFKVEETNLAVLAHRGNVPQKKLPQRFAMGDTLIGRQLLVDQKPVIIRNMGDDTPLAHDLKQVTGEHFEAVHGQARSWLAVPLTIKDQVIGIMALQHDESDRYYTPSHADLVLGFANQAAVAMENARLYEQAQTLAALEERQRLARDLHDAVSQTLFSASLSADVLPRLWERDRVEGRRCLKEVHRLTRGALAEMRTLLLELRPAALVATELGDLLGQLAEAITTRARVPVAVTADGRCTLPPEVQVAVYRIAQETLNNVAKHAGASQATVALRCVGEGDGLELRISDDGRGFDPNRARPDRLGLGIMRERAEAIGAEFKIDSQIGHGSQVVVVWPKPGAETKYSDA